MLHISQEKLNSIYKDLYLIRITEEKIAEIYYTDKIKSPVHLSIGQESPSVGVCSALRSSDIVFGTYRSHAMYLAKGGDLNKMIAELYGKEEGLAGGKAGSMHLADKAAGIMGTSAIVSTTIPQAVGYALAEKMKGKDTVVAVFFGDGATEEGVFWESLNFAAIKKLPILFVCENNNYAIHTPWWKRIPSQNYCEKSEAFGIKAKKVEGNDVIATYLFTKNLIDKGFDEPCFLEIETYRWKEHVGPNDDWDLGYREKKESERWITNDQLEVVGREIEFKDKKSIETQCLQFLEKAFEFAENSKFPSVDSLFDDVFQ